MWVKAMLRIDKTVVMGHKVRNQSTCKTTSDHSIGRRYKGIVKIEFWRDISTEGHMPKHMIKAPFSTMTVKCELGEMGRWSW